MVNRKDFIDRGKELRDAIDECDVRIRKAAEDALDAAIGVTVEPARTSIIDAVRAILREVTDRRKELKDAIDERDTRIRKAAKDAFDVAVGVTVEPARTSIIDAMRKILLEVPE